MTTSLLETVTTYCRAWDEPDLKKRRLLLEASVTSDIDYSDPTVQIHGLEELITHISTVSAKYPGSLLELLSDVDQHHGVARFAWRKVLADGTALPDSIDIVEIAEDGRLKRVIGFFGHLEGS